ncbi:MAG TPA: dTDP-4-dehydrorhamnose 3,5-epimerase [Polyangiaceae bacterium]|nr:dTDP-4-dehydrorhamnose 3,5-epimerase [Polyangiaceae bacterium]
MEIIELPLAGAKLIRPRIFRDSRGFFLESYSQPRYHDAGITESWVQDNHSMSARGTLRGLHYQSAPGQAKLVRVTLGRIFDVLVDIRPSSPTFGRWHGEEIDADDHEQIYVPIGFAHGFAVLTEVAEVQYKVSSPYDGATECAIRWNDPDIGVVWPVAEPILSARDQSSESFAAYRARVEAAR